MSESAGERNATTKQKDRLGPIVSWSLYDFANSAYATSVMAILFPAMFKQYWNPSDVDATVSTFRLSLATSGSGLAVAVLAPVLGAIADKGSAKKRFLTFFLAVGVTMTAALYLIDQGQWLMAALVYATSMIGFMGANTFYDSLLPGIVSEKKVDLVSGLGFGVGYLGGGLLLVAHFTIISDWQSFGFADVGAATRACLASVAVWWALFALPLLLFVKEERSSAPSSGGNVIREGFTQLWRTFQEVRRLKHTGLFLLGYWFYIDGVDTVILMATDYGLSLGFTQEALMKAFLVTQFVGFPSAIAFGKLGEKLGPKTGLYIGIVAYIGICTYGYFVKSESQFWGIAIAVGLVQGGIQALSRSLYTRLIPPAKAGEFFGFYNMLGKFAAVLGPLLMGIVGVVTGETRYGILSIIVLFLLGGWFLSRVDVAAGQRAAIDVDDEL